ncbi:hypothetical protein HQ39_02295 [Porphyromonas sp. COT-108 OH2963]|uniref:Nitroreductase domain-containing protein n=1 Tax=Porphyromonas canoris TaxID=36875 RepID=A0ABR4XMD3_9PORP|nr:MULTISPECIES: nitroreductase family protein [Porphyromonas]KGN92894.1 hypothetical protein HQ43_03200 [Porphyromonas canoris]KGN96185.1 hypothetical protein HQ39_02295 [Porphyromonas sp. COT-108 OH2963]
MSHVHFISSKRKSIRKFAPVPVPQEAVQEILEVGLRAPSSMSTNATRFIVVEDKSTLEALSKSKKMGSKFLAEAPLAIVVAVDLNKSRRPEAEAAIAATMMQLAVTDLELGSCWIHVADSTSPDGEESEAVVKRVLNIPPSIGVLCILALGVPANDEDLAFRDIEIDWGRVSIDTFKDIED